MIQPRNIENGKPNLRLQTKPDENQTLEMEHIPSRPWIDENEPQSSTSTVIISESPRGKGPIMKLDTERDDGLEVVGSQDASAEKNFSVDQSTISKDSKLSQNKQKPRNKINLEIYLKMENKLTLVKEAIISGGTTFSFCKEYIQLAP